MPFILVGGAWPWWAGPGLTYQCRPSLFSLLGGKLSVPHEGTMPAPLVPHPGAPLPPQPLSPPLRPSCVMHAENLAWSAMLRPEGEHSGEVEAGQAREPCVRCSGAAARGLGPVKALSPFLPPPHCPLTSPLDLSSFSFHLSVLLAPLPFCFLTAPLHLIPCVCPPHPQPSLLRSPVHPSRPLSPPLRPSVPFSASLPVRSLARLGPATK